MEIIRPTPHEISPYKPLSSLRSLHYKLPRMKSVLCALTVALAGFSATSRGYVLEGQSWPAGTVVVLQLSLGNAGRTLQDGNTSWNDAVAPVANMWNSKVQRVQVTQVLNSGAPCSSGDHLNSVVFASTIFGQGFGANTLAVTYYRYIGIDHDRSGHAL